MKSDFFELLKDLHHLETILENLESKGKIPDPLIKDYEELLRELKKFSEQIKKQQK